MRPLAYHNRPLLVGQGQNIAQPYLIALMTSLARVHRGDVVYETGTGAGYHAAVLAEIADRVYSVEVIDRLAIRAARIILEDLGYRNVETRIGDGYFGWPEKGRSDVRPACPIYNWFTEGFDTPDLKSANALLDEPERLPTGVDVTAPEEAIRSVGFELCPSNIPPWPRS